MGETVRFSEVVKTAGTPEVYLPLTDPKHDRDFMRSVREDRVLSLKQKPTGTRKDFGTVGFLPEKYITYLIFPKPLTPFKGRRVVGIKYDALKQAPVTTARASATTRSRSIKPKPAPKPKPRPRRFHATVRLVSTNEVRVTVQASNESDARRKAEQTAREQRPRSVPRIETELLSLSESGE